MCFELIRGAAVNFPQKGQVFLYLIAVYEAIEPFINLMLQE
jgi:hypothetical protein